MQAVLRSAHGVERRVFDELCLAVPEDGAFSNEPRTRAVERDGIVTLGPPHSFSPHYRNQLLVIALLLAVLVGVCLAFGGWLMAKTTIGRPATGILVLVGFCAWAWGVLCCGVALRAVYVPLSRRKGHCVVFDRGANQWTLPRQGLVLPGAAVKAVHVGHGEFVSHAGWWPRKFRIVQVTVEFVAQDRTRFAPVLVNDLVAYEDLVRQLRDLLPVPVREVQLGTARITAVSGLAGN